MHYARRQEYCLAERRSAALYGRAEAARQIQAAGWRRVGQLMNQGAPRLKDRASPG
jgi:hypothetical protein